MSFLPSVSFRDTPQMDAFGRLRVSEPFPLFDNTSQYGDISSIWENASVGGSVSHRPNEGSLRLSTGGVTSGNYYIRQTKAYWRYQPGRSLNIEMTFAMGTAVTNGVARIGYFDTNNGIFLERNGSTINIVRRTYTSGSAVDNQVAQSSWNVDKMDGSGVSGKTIDLTKANILFIQLQYLGVGRVQVGFVIDGISYVAHQFLNANNLSTAYMSTGSLPVRQEVRNVGAASGTLTMDVVCASVNAGGHGNSVYPFARTTAITPMSSTTTLKPVISIRAATLLGGTTGGGTITNRAHINVLSAFALVASQIHEYEVILNGTLTGPSWQNNDAKSVVDYDVTASAISGGTLIQAGYIAAGGGGANAFTTTQDIAFNDAAPLVYSGLNGTQDIISLCARAVTSTGSVYGGFAWEESL